MSHKIVIVTFGGTCDQWLVGSRLNWIKHKTYFLDIFKPSHFTSNQVNFDLTFWWPILTTQSSLLFQFYMGIACVLNNMCVCCWLIFFLLTLAPIILNLIFIFFLTLFFLQESSVCRPVSLCELLHKLFCTKKKKHLPFCQ